MSSSEEVYDLCECWEQAAVWKVKYPRIRDALRGDVDSLKTLLELSKWFNKNKSSQAAIFLRGCESHHQVLNSENRHLFRRTSFGAAKLFIEKCFDVNAQNDSGNTALHLSCMRHSYERVHNDSDLEVLSMLLWYGADPMIKNCDGFTAFDILITEEAEYCRNPRPLSIIQHLFYSTLDEYADWELDAVIFLKVALVDSWIFDEIINTNIRVVFHDNFPTTFLCFTSDSPTSILFTMKSHYLQIIIEKFEYVVKELLHMWPKSLAFSDLSRPILIENFDILLNSNLQLEITDWLRNVDITGAIWNITWFSTEPLSAQKFICFLLSYGMNLYENDLSILFNFFHCKFQCYEMFKMFLYMDVVQPEQDSTDEKQYQWTYTLPRILLYNVTSDVPKMIQQRLFSVECLAELLPYFTIPSDFFAGNDWEEQVQKRPQVPLLVELARNVFRKYFTESLGITNARQFYTLLKLLPISTYHKAIITYEAKLYPDL